MIVVVMGRTVLTSSSTSVSLESVRVGVPEAVVEPVPVEAKTEADGSATLVILVADVGVDVGVDEASPVPLRTPQTSTESVSPLVL